MFFWFGLVWFFGLVWLVWFGLVWFGLVWFDLVVLGVPVLLGLAPLPIQGHPPWGRWLCPPLGGWEVGFALVWYALLCFGWLVCLPVLSPFFFCCFLCVCCMFLLSSSVVPLPPPVTLLPCFMYFGCLCSVDISVLSLFLCWFLTFRKPFSLSCFISPEVAPSAFASAMVVALW